MAEPQIAIGQDGRRVSLWCLVFDRKDDGTIIFDVINGAWRGSIKDNMVTIGGYHGGDATQLPGQITWEGKAPFRSADYNEAIAWIEEQLGG